jgi:uncharacterized protein YbjT (DUF2867 family)
MKQIKVIITGATGMVGEGVLFECLQNPAVSEVLIINRKHYDLVHHKLREILLPSFFDLFEYADALTEYDACFFCAGISSVGMKEDKFRHITYDTTMAFAKALLAANPNMVFTYVSGSHTDSSEKGRIMWARVKGKTENDLAKLGFKAEYNFRPGAMQPFEGQRNWKQAYKVIVKIIKLFAPKSIITMHELGKAMINATTIGYPKNILEIPDIKALATQSA